MNVLQENVIKVMQLIKMIVNYGNQIVSLMKIMMDALIGHIYVKII